MIGDSNSTTVSPKQDVSGSGTGVQGGGQAGRDDARNVKGSGTYAEQGAVANKGIYAAGNLAHIKAAKGSNVTVTTADPAVAIAAINASQSSLTKFMDSASAASAASTSSTNSLLTKLLDQSGSLAQTGATGGASAAASTYTRLFLWSLGIVALAGVAILYLRKK